jgi:mono/diheme cytochrome c family protein
MKKILLLSTIVTLAVFCQRDPYREGSRLYAVHCSNCHGENGQGLGELIPPLAQADFITLHRDELACILVNGLNDTIVVNGKTYFGQAMPANRELSDIQVTNILNFIQHSWGNPKQDFTLENVRALLSRCP